MEYEIEAYKDALFDYRLSKRFPFMKKILRTDEGFCHYFGENIKHFPILYSLRPREKYVYWFNFGDVDSRIKLLEQAIKIAKDRSCKNSGFMTRIKRYLKQ